MAQGIVIYNKQKSSNNHAGFYLFIFLLEGHMRLGYRPTAETRKANLNNNMSLYTFGNL